MYIKSLVKCQVASVFQWTLTKPVPIAVCEEMAIDSGMKSASVRQTLSPSTAC